MVNSEAISEIDRLVEHHLSIAKALQVARAHLAPNSTTTLRSLVSLPTPEDQSLSVAGHHLSLIANDREARIKALPPTEFRNMKYNSAVEAALQVWGSEEPRPVRADIVRILKKGGFSHPRGVEVGARDSIRNAVASGKGGGSVLKINDDDPDGEYGLKEWFPASVRPTRSARRKPSQQKEMVDPLPEEQSDSQAEA